MVINTGGGGVFIKADCFYLSLKNQHSRVLADCLTFCVCFLCTWHSRNLYISMAPCYSMGFGKDGKGVIIQQALAQTLGTLAANTGIILGTNLATVERFRMLKSDVFCVITAGTGAELGGLELYLADGDLTLAEIEETIEANGPLGPNDITTSNRAMRPVFRVGAVVLGIAGASDAIHLRGLDGSPLLEVKPRWTFASVKSWNWVIYNAGLVLTTGSSANIRARSFGVWVT